MTMRVRAAIVLGVATVLAWAAAGSAQSTGPTPHPRLVIDSMYGPDLYRMYCATCHGRDGTGDGPAVPALKVRPPDLTRLAERHEGMFPSDKVEAIIRGTDAVPALGSDEMPMWGPIFRALDPADPIGARTAARIRNLVEHLASLQRR